MTSPDVTSSKMKPPRPYQPIVLYWEARQGLNNNAQGIPATRQQLQTVLGGLGNAPLSNNAVLSSLVPGAVVQLADGLYWLTQDWQVLCL